MRTALTEYEIKVLRSVNGEQVLGLCWGAAMGEAVKSLCGSGHVSRNQTWDGTRYEITEKGKAVLSGVMAGA